MPDFGLLVDRSPHIIADLCEIICFYENQNVSRSDVEGLIETRGTDSLLKQIEAAAESSAEVNDRIQQLTEDTFSHLMFRQAAFSEWYPFKVNHDVIEQNMTLSDRHKIYITLLAMSRLAMFPATQRIQLAADFEKVCCLAMRGLLPSWKVYHFGKGGGDRPDFGNKLSDALITLAKKLRDPTIPSRIEELSPHDSGDAGIDIVAMYEWEDSACAVPAYFAQCAAQQNNWPNKRFEASAKNIDRYISFSADPAAMLFIPLCFRSPDGNWVDSSGHSSLLIDRLRMTELLDSHFRLDLRTPIDALALIREPVSVGLH